MILATQLDVTRMLDVGTARASMEPQGSGVPQSFMDLVREAARGGNESHDVADTLRQDEARAQDNIVTHSERAGEDVASPGFHESKQAGENQVEHTDGMYHSGKNRNETERQHETRDQDIVDGKHGIANEESSRLNKRVREERVSGKKTEALNDSDERGNDREHKMVPGMSVQENAQALLEALRSVQNPSNQFNEFERALKSFQEQFESADGGRRMQLAQELRVRMKEFIGRLEEQDNNARNTNDTNIAHVKARVKALAESLERGRHSGGERRENAGNEPAASKVNAESQARQETPTTGEMRFELSKHNDTPLRVEGASNATRGGIQHMNTPASSRAPFGNEQFEMLMQQARIVVRDARNGNFTMNLYPETLGRVNVNLGLEDGVLMGRFLVDTPEAREAMMESLDRLLSQLAEAGIEVGAFQVNVRGERDRLVQNLQGYLSENRRRTESESRSEYDAQTVRSHDGLIDVIA